jgi:hypothetical protein
VKVNDLESLLSVVAALGVGPQDVSELREAVEGDDSDLETPKGRPGSRVTQFLGKLTLGALKSAGQTGIQEGGKAISKAILTYYGIT